MNMALVHVVATVLVIIVSCAPAKDHNISVHGMEADVTDTELTSLAPVVVKGVVMARTTGKYADHPQLKAVLTPEEEELVTAGAEYIEWRIHVTEVVKGTVGSEVIARRAREGEHVGFGSSVNEIADLPVGATGTFWLEPGDAFTEAPYFVLIRARTDDLSA